MASTAGLDALDRTVTVIGGVLGRRLCLMWSCTGRPVELFDTSPEQVQSALKFIKENIDTQLERTGCERRGKVTASSDLAEAVQDSWMVIEAVPEILDVKIQMMAQLGKMARPDCILATNSSPFRSSNMLENVKVQNRVLNTHYYMSPSNACVELMSSGNTDPAIFDLLIKECAAVGFKAINVKQESTA